MMLHQEIPPHPDPLPGGERKGRRNVSGGGRVRGYKEKPSPNAQANAVKLRQTLTDVEQKLWYLLRNRQFAGAKFRRQCPIGKYIVDFVCKEKHLIIELDGGQHNQDQGYDKTRTQFLQLEGYTVLRFWNNEVMKNMEGVLLVIKENI